MIRTRNWSVVVLLAFLFCLSVESAQAQTTISSEETDPQVTSTTGDLDITSSGSVTISTDDTAAVTIDSDNPVDNAGSITSSGTGGIGIAVDPAGAMADITNTGTITTNGTDGIGIFVGGDLDGVISNTEVITSQVSGTQTDSFNHGIYVNAGVSGGIFNDGDSIATAGDDDGQINTLGAGSAIYISAIGANGPAGATSQNISISNAMDWGITNQGSLSSLATTSGIAVNTIRVEGGGGITVDLGMGIFNEGGNIFSSALDADATAISIGEDVTLDTIENSGAINVLTSASSGGAGGDAYGIHLQPGSMLSGSFLNSGTLSVTANGTGQDAFGVFDESGTLSDIENSGTITAIANGTGGSGFAFDLSANSTGITFANTGSITGDILFGSMNDSLTNTGGTINGDIDFGTGTNSFELIDSTFSGNLAGSSLSFEATNATLNNRTTMSYALSDALFDADSTLGVSIWGFQNQIGGLAVAGSAEFEDGANIAIDMRSLQTTDIVTYTIVTSTGLTATPANLDLQNPSFLYNMSLAAMGGDDIVLTVDRKGFDEMGLFPNQASAFQAGFDVLAGQSDLSLAFSTIGNAKDLRAALNQLLPTPDSASIDIMRAFNNVASGAHTNRLNMLRDIDHIGRSSPAYLAEDFAPSSAPSSAVADVMAFSALAQRMDPVEELMKQNKQKLYANGKTYASGPSVWGQQSYTNWNRGAGSSGRGYDGLTYGFTGGIDAPMLGLNALGLSFTYGGGEIEEDNSTDEPLVVSTRQVNLYGSFWSHGFYLDTSAGIGFDKYESERNVVFGGVNRRSFADWSGMHYSVDVNSGLRARAGVFGVGVSGGLGYLKVKEDAYQETGGGAGVDLNVASRDTTSVLARFGLDGDMWLPMGDTFLTITARGGYAHEFGDDVARSEARFVGSPNTFVTSSNALDGGRYYGGLGLGVLFRGVSLNLNYDGEFDDDYMSNMLAVTGRFRF